MIDDEVVLRSYSMSSAPRVDADLQVTVKRVPDGVVSNYLNDKVAAGDFLDVSTPTGTFVLDDSDDDVVLFAGGSGITPVFSIVKSALRTTTRNVRVFFANRDRASAIFGDALDALAAESRGRLRVHHHEDAVRGFVTADDVTRFAGDADATFYIGGPAPFMEIVEAALPGRRVHIDRFTPAAGEPIDEPVATAQAESVTITIGTKTETVAQRGRSTILQSARWAGLKAPSSCEAGHCATCMARVVEGRVDMLNNEVLTDDEVAEGWVLTCQSIPVTPVVKVVYE
jgi:ferredoxin-NADP reductase